MTSVPLDARRALLRELPLDPPLGRVDLVEDEKPWEHACREGWSFLEWTAHGKLRHPRLLGVRFDKPARDVIREQ